MPNDEGWFYYVESKDKELSTLGTSVFNESGFFGPLPDTFILDNENMLIKGNWRSDKKPLIRKLLDV